MVQQYSDLQEESDESPSHVEISSPSGFLENVKLCWNIRTNLEKCLILFTFILLIILLIVIIVASASHHSQKVYHLKNITSHKVCLTPDCIQQASFVLKTANFSAKPCDDFYEYACGQWIADSFLPAGKSRYGVFYQVSDRNTKVLRRLLNRPMSDFKSTLMKQTKDYFESCMNLTKLNQLHMKPLVDLVKSRNSLIKTNFSIQQLMLAYPELDLLVSVSVSADDKNSSLNKLFIDQSGLLLPSREYYLNQNRTETIDKAKELLYEVIALIESGNVTPNHTVLVDNVMEFEGKLAEIFASREDRRDDEKLYNPITIKELNKRYTFIDWLSYLNILASKGGESVTESEVVIVRNFTYLDNLDKLIGGLKKKPDFETLMRAYKNIHLITSYWEFLSEPVLKLRNKYKSIVRGQKGELERWETCVMDTVNTLGFVVGDDFLHSAFSEAAKKEARNVMGSIRSMFKRNLKSVDWMDDGTKRVATDKVNAVHDKIGYPFWIQNQTRLNEKYGGYMVDLSAYFETNVRVQTKLLEREFRKLHKPVDKTDWSMFPSTVNAYYNPSANEIVVPAGILQMPFYQAGVPKSLNFGGIGVVMGHELTHGFDDQGRKYDKNGNMRHWWPDKVVTEFESRKKCMVDQYSQYQLSGQNVNGALTIGENIADNGGLKMSLLAYKDWLLSNGGSELVLPGVSLNSMQLFFLSFAQVWCSKQTEKSVFMNLKTNPHSPGKFRVIGTLSNSKEFAAAFNCPPGSGMNPVKKCQVW